MSTSHAQDNISFESSELSGVALTHATSLQFGPDGRLYVSQQNGVIKIYTIEKNGPNNYEVTGTETILSIQQIANHNDDGSANTLETTRQITGIMVKGTAENPVLYVGSSDSRIGGGGTKGDKDLDTNSGMISRLTWKGTAWDKVDLIRGLPRSEENHANNGMELDEVDNVLYVAVGGHTNAGSPSNNFAFTTEYALSASIVSINMDAIEAMPVRGSGNNQYVYDIPTLDDPARNNIANPDYDPSVPGSPDSVDVNDPFGGNDGLNQGKIIAGGPVQVYSPGYRNPYDVVITMTPGKEGRLYTIDNGANGGWGGYPEYEGTDSVTNNYVPGEPGSTGPGQNDAKVNNLDNLHLVSKPGMSPIYGGHPNPVRANPSGAGLYWYDNITETAHFELNPTSDWPPVPVAMANPIEGDFQNPGVDDGALYTWPASTNGFDEYTATKFFDGALAGDLIVTSFDHNVYRVKLTTNGEQVDFVEPIASGLSNPLDVVAQGAGEIFEGTIWIAAYSSNAITILEPQFNGAWNVVNSADNSVPTARHEGAYVEAGGKFYLMGGRGSRPLDIYDPVTNTWTTGADYPQQIHHFQAVELNGLIYVVGAFTGNFPSETPVSNILIYNPVTDSWSTGAEIPMSRRRGSAGVVVYNNKIYMVCGIINGHTDGWVPWVDVYDPATNTWTVLPDAPRSRDHFHAALEGNKIYVAGGRRTGFGGSTFAATVPEVDVYDILSGTWTTLPASANIPTQRAGTSTVVFNNEIVVIGGESGSQSIAHNEAEALDPFTNAWRSLGALNTGRHATQAIVYNGKIYTAAGSADRGGGPELTSQEAFSGTAICTGNNTSYTLDDDNDGYSNADEADSGTNPCSAASVPPDNDGDFISDLNDPDDDNDGIPDTTDKFALDAQNGTNTHIPIDYPFLNGVPGTGLFGLGLTGLMSNGMDYQDLFDPDHPDLIMGGAVGLASLPANSGDALNNDQQYAFQFGVDVNSSTPTFTIHGRVLGNPFFNSQTPLSQSQGIYIGTGDQDNYLKAAVVANNGNPGIQILFESNGSVTYSNTFPITNILQEESVDLYFDVAPASGTVQIKYTINAGASPTNVGPLINLTGPVLNTVQTTAAMAVGIIASSGSTSSSFVAAWDFINITSPLTPELRINAGGGAVSYNNENWEADQYYSGTSEGRTDNNLPIEGTLRDELYQHYRFGKTFSYNIPVNGQGPFAVRLHFSENYHGVSNTKGIGARVFNVDIESGQAQLMNYDLIESAGAPATAIVETINNIMVNDGMLTLDFTTIQDNACIAAIEVYSVTNPGNLPPVVINPGNQTFNEGAAVSLQIQASDPDAGDILTFTQTGLPASLVIDANTGLISGTLEANAGEFPVTVTATDQNGFSDQVAFNITISENNAEGTAIVRLNSGGSAFTFDNNVWEADQFFSTSKKRTDSTQPIEGTLNDGLYRSYRYGKTFSYNIPVSTEGPFIVKLHFSENHHGIANSKGIGARVFNIDIENGQAQLANYDIIEQAGAPATAIVETFYNISVNDGSLSLDFTTIQDNACIAGIEIFSIDGDSNLPPVVTNPGNITFGEGEIVSLQVQATDPNEGDVLTFTASGLPSSLTIDSNAGLINGTITASVGDYSVTVTATDQDGLFDQETFMLSVTSEGGSNVAPILALIGNKTVDEGTTLNVNVSASDADGTVPVLSASWLPSFAAFTDNNDGTGILTLSPSTGDAGTYNITITAEDTGGLNDQETISISVLEDDTSPTPLVRLNAGGWLYNYNGQTWETDQFSTGGEKEIDSSLPIEGTLNDKLYQYYRFGKTFSYNIPVGSAGPFMVKLHFSENYHGISNTKGIGARVFNVDIENGQGQLANYDLIEQAGAPATAIVETFNNITVSDGSLTVSFSTVQDNACIAGIEIFSVSGTANLPPVVINPGNLSFVEGENVSLQIQASEPDAGDVLAFGASGLPSGLTIDSNTGLISGIVTASPGDYPVTVTATDQDGLYDQEAFILGITSEGGSNTAPVLAFIGDKSVSEGSVLNVSVSASDANGTVPVLSASSLPSFATFTDNNDGTGLLELSPLDGDLGTYNITFTAEDSGGLSDQETISITVLESGTTLNPLVRLNAGGWLYNYNGETWVADQFSTGGEPEIDSSLPIEGTLNDKLYQYYRFGKTFSYNIPVGSPGPFMVKLHFSENYHGISNTKGIGARVFNVDIENGQGQLTNYDLIGQAGAPATAIVETFNDIMVSDGSLTLSFTTVQDNACIAGIEIFSNSNAPTTRMMSLELTDEDLINGKVKIYPNPINNNFNIVFNSEEMHDVTITIFDGIGRQFDLGKHKIKPENATLELDVSRFELKDGLYYLYVQEKYRDPIIFKLFKN